MVLQNADFYAEKEKTAMDINNAETKEKEIWIFIQESGGHPLDVSFELLSKGRELAKELDAKLCALMIGSDLSSKEELNNYADYVYYIEDSVFSSAIELNYARAAEIAISEYQPEIMLFGATKFGRAMAPAIAAKLHTGLTADCTILEIDKEKNLLQQTRPAFGGNLMATIICPDHRPQMATVRPGIFQRIEPDPSIKTEFIDLKKALPKLNEALDKLKDTGIKILETTDQPLGGSIKDAEILIVCGRGIGSKANVAKAAKLAHKISENIGIPADYGVTRPLVDLGWAEYSHQVGQTGLSVAPRVLVSLGVSGAIQHLAGISGAKTIIAVNTDPEAPIFRAAHYALNADCMEIVDEMLAALDS